MKKNESIVYIEGNVGVGKSTFLSFLQKHSQADVFFEPSDLWQNINGYNLLQQFFLDQKRWAYTLQSYIVQTRIDQFKQIEMSSHACLVERSIYSGRYCFAQVAYDLGFMNGLEWSLYTILWQREAENLVNMPAGFIYLRTPVDICYQRIMQRGRMEEQPITLDYLQRLEQQYENWFIHGQGVDSRLLQVPVLVLDFSENIIDNIHLHEQYLSTTLYFLKNIE